MNQHCSLIQNRSFSNRACSVFGGCGRWPLLGLLFCVGLFSFAQNSTIYASWIDENDQIISRPNHTDEVLTPDRFGDFIISRGSDISLKIYNPEQASGVIYISLGRRVPTSFPTDYFQDVFGVAVPLTGESHQVVHRTLVESDWDLYNTLTEADRNQAVPLYLRVTHGTDGGWDYKYVDIETLGRKTGETPCMDAYCGHNFDNPVYLLWEPTPLAPSVIVGKDPVCLTPPDSSCPEAVSESCVDTLRDLSDQTFQRNWKGAVEGGTYLLEDTGASAGGGQAYSEWITAQVDESGNVIPLQRFLHQPGRNQFQITFPDLPSGVEESRFVIICRRIAELGRASEVDPFVANCHISEFSSGGILPIRVGRDLMKTPGISLLVSENQNGPFIPVEQLQGRYTQGMRQARALWVKPSLPAGLPTNPDWFAYYRGEDFLSGNVHAWEQCSGDETPVPLTQPIRYTFNNDQESLFLSMVFVDDHGYSGTLPFIRLEPPLAPAAFTGTIELLTDWDDWTQGEDVLLSLSPGLSAGEEAQFSVWLVQDRGSWEDIYPVQLVNFGGDCAPSFVYRTDSRVTLRAELPAGLAVSDLSRGPLQFLIRAVRENEGGFLLCHEPFLNDPELSGNFDPSAFATWVSDWSVADPSLPSDLDYAVLYQEASVTIPQGSTPMSFGLQHHGPDAPTSVSWRWSRLRNSLLEVWVDGHWILSRDPQDGWFQVAGSDAFSGNWYATTEMSGTNGQVNMGPHLTTILPAGPNPFSGFTDDFFVLDNGVPQSQEVQVCFKARFPRDQESQIQELTFRVTPEGGDLNLNEFSAMVDGQIGNEFNRTNQTSINDLFFAVTVSQSTTRNAYLALYKQTQDGTGFQIVNGTCAFLGQGNINTSTYFEEVGRPQSWPEPASPDRMIYIQALQPLKNLLQQPGVYELRAAKQGCNENLYRAVRFQVVNGERLAVQFHYRDHIGTSTMTRRYHLDGSNVEESPLAMTLAQSNGDLIQVVLRPDNPNFVWYDAFGERIATVNQDETARYTDHEYDTFTGWNYMKARFSTPAAAGKFNRPDPARDWDWTTPGSLNLYQYVRNNPITGYDPTGLEILLDPDMEPHVREFLLRDLRSLTNDDVSFEGNKVVLKINKSGDLPTGTELLRYLTGTEQTVTLTAHSITDEEDNKDPEPSHVIPVPISMDAVTPGKGSGSRVTIDYSNLSVAKTYDSKTKDTVREIIPRHIELGHELIHAYQFSLGQGMLNSNKTRQTFKDVDGSWVTREVRRMELVAIGVLPGLKFTENLLRKEHGLNIRLTH